MRVIKERNYRFIGFIFLALNAVFCGASDSSRPPSSEPCHLLPYVLPEAPRTTKETFLDIVERHRPNRFDNPNTINALLMDLIERYHAKEISEKLNSNGIYIWPGTPNTLKIIRARLREIVPDSSRRFESFPWRQIPSAVHERLPIARLRMSRFRDTPSLFPGGAGEIISELLWRGLNLWEIVDLLDKYNFEGGWVRPVVGHDIVRAHTEFTRWQNHVKEAVRVRLRARESNTEDEQFIALQDLALQDLDKVCLTPQEIADWLGEGLTASQVTERLSRTTLPFPISYGVQSEAANPEVRSSNPLGGFIPELIRTPVAPPHALSQNEVLARVEEVIQQLQRGILNPVTEFRSISRLLSEYYDRPAPLEVTSALVDIFRGIPEGKETEEVRLQWLEALLRSSAQTDPTPTRALLHALQSDNPGFRLDVLDVVRARAELRASVRDRLQVLQRPEFSNELLPYITVIVNLRAIMKQTENISESAIASLLEKNSELLGNLDRVIEDHSLDPAFSQQRQLIQSIRESLLQFVAIESETRQHVMSDLNRDIRRLSKWMAGRQSEIEYITVILNEGQLASRPEEPVPGPKKPARKKPSVPLAQRRQALRPPPPARVVPRPHISEDLIEVIRRLQNLDGQDLDEQAFVEQISAIIPFAFFVSHIVPESTRLFSTESSPAYIESFSAFSKAVENFHYSVIGASRRTPESARATLLEAARNLGRLIGP